VREFSPSFPGFVKSLLERRGLLGGSVGLAIDLLLVLTLALVFARLIWVLLSPAAFVAMPNADLAGPQTSGIVFRADPGVFQRFNPFNRDLAVSEVQVEESAPETSLNLKIRLLLSSTDSEQSVVRIELPNGQVQRFSEGDQVVSGVQIERILSDRVVLMRRGEREVLLDREMQVLDVVEPDGSPFVSPTPRTQIAGGSEETETADRNVTIDGDTLDYRTFFSSILIRNVAMPGGETAIKIVEGSDQSLMDKLGLMVGDEIIEINGHNLKTESVEAVAADIRNDTELDITLLRNGQELARRVEFQ
jgi:general secretion pathway protein C